MREDEISGEPLMTGPKPTRSLLPPVLAQAGMRLAVHVDEAILGNEQGGVRPADIVVCQAADAAPSFDRAHVDHTVVEIHRAPPQIQCLHAIESVHEDQSPEGLELIVANRPQEVGDLRG